MSTKKPKSLALRRAELADAEILLRTSRLRALDGEVAFTKVLSVQLRALLCQPRSGTGSPLLFDLASLIRFKPMCQAVTFDLIGEHDSTGGHGEVGVLRRFVSSPDWNNATELEPFEEWLNRAQFGSRDVEKPERSPSDIIRSHADRLGGAHYDRTLEAEEDTYRRTSLRPDGRFTFFDHLLIDVAEVAEHHARKIGAALDEHAYKLLEAGFAAEGKPVTVQVSVESPIPISGRGHDSRT